MEPAGRVAHPWVRGVRNPADPRGPANFNLLGVGWYVNEPADGKDANLAVLADYQMIAARDIAEGEELTVRYDTFSRADASRG